MNKRTNRLGFTFVTGLCFVFVMFFFIERALAADVILPTEYYFVFNGQNRKAGTEYEMKLPEILLNVTSGTWEPDTTVEWVSSEPGVVTIDKSVSATYGSHFVKLVRTGPGYSTITAVIKHGGSSYSISCLIKVDLQFDAQKTGMTTAKTTNDKILILDTIDQTKQIYLKYVDYTPDGEVVPVSGSAISASAVIWESDNEGVATINDNGVVRAVGSGNAVITATTNTMSSNDRPMTIKMTVIVAPKFSLTYTNASGSTTKADSYDSENNPNAVASGVPSDFVIESNATLASNLKWEVIDCSNNKKLPEGKSAKMTYSVSEISGSVTFTGVKAGTYKIYAFAEPTYNTSTNAPYAYLKIIVPIDLGNINLVMTVNDTYSLIDNTNITGVGIFGTPVYLVGNQNIAMLDTSDYIIKARRKGNVTIELTYNSSLDLFDPDYVVPKFTINVTVIDGISLSATSATLYTKGTLLLTAIVTDPTESIVWSSDNPTVASVDNGLVTGLKAGTAVITASQTINGVVKKASCTITVQASVTNIKVTPSTAALEIGGFATLHAEVTPNNLSNVKLQWKSSNENVVKIVDNQPLTTTIQAVAGGNAVISAINQDNVVVGYCHVTVRQPVTGISLSETNGILKLSDKSFQIRAIVYPENALNKGIKWTSTDQSIARVDVNGNVSLLKPGKVTIIATSLDNPSVTAMCNLTIEVPVVSVVLDETNKTMYVGDRVRLSYTMQPTDASNNVVTWTSTNSKVATVDAKGLVTAKSVGTTVIIIRTADGGRTSYCNITVKRTADAVKLDVSKLELKVGEYYYIKADFTPKDATDINVKWESNDTKIAVVDSNGKVTAKSPGTAFIMAKTDNGSTAFCEVKVIQPVTGVMLNFTEKTIYTRGSFQLNASVIPSTATNLDVTWKSSNEKIATVSKKGEVTGISGGVAIITCTTNEGGFYANCYVTVKEPVTTIKLNYDTYNLGIGKSFNLEATVMSENASNKNVVWISSDENVAVVNQKGKVTGIAIGTATITAIAQDGSEVEVSCEVNVVNPVTSITLNKTYITKFVGESETLKATIKPSSATVKGITWTSSDNSVAIVDAEGVVTALKPGTATISARAQDNSGKYASCAISVFERVPSTGITLQDKRITLVNGETKLVNVVLIPSASTDSLKWSTDNPSIATVSKADDRTGKITAKGTGTAYITAMTDTGKTATVEVTVIGLNVTSITLGQYERYNYLEVEGYTGTVKWTIDNPAIAEVRNGNIVSKAIGTATITATVNGRKLNCKITVTKD